MNTSNHSVVQCAVCDVSVWFVGCFLFVSLFVLSLWHVWFLRAPVYDTPWNHQNFCGTKRTSSCLIFMMNCSAWWDLFVHFICKEGIFCLFSLYMLKLSLLGVCFSMSWVTSCCDTHEDHRHHSPAICNALPAFDTGVAETTQGVRKFHSSVAVGFECLLGYPGLPVSTRWLCLSNWAEP